MCILFFVVNEKPASDGYKLILAANRDAYYERPTLSAAAWNGQPNVFGGRDMEPGREGGTWFAFSTDDKLFKFGAVLIIAGEAKHDDDLGRGHLVADYVSGGAMNDVYTSQLQQSGKRYKGYNLVTIEIREGTPKIIHCSNVHDEWHEWPQQRVLGFSNSPTCTSLAKVKAGRKQFEEIIRQKLTKDLLVESLMELLKDRSRHWPDPELYGRVPEWSKSLSSIFVQMPEIGYGSRTRNVITIDAYNNVDYYEETMLGTDPVGEWNRTHITTKF